MSNNIECVRHKNRHIFVTNKQAFMVSSRLSELGKVYVLEWAVQNFLSRDSSLFYSLHASISERSLSLDEPRTILHKNGFHMVEWNNQCSCIRAIQYKLDPS